MSDFHTMKLGRRPSAPDHRTLNFPDFLSAAIEPPPAASLWQTPVTDWGVMGNDEYGNCVIVTAAHILLSMRANKAKDTRRISDAAVVALSRDMGALDGYDILQRLKYWRRNGMWGDYLWAFARLNSRNPFYLQVAIHHLGAADIGLQLPLAWQTADVWDTGQGPRYRPASWGLHSVPLVGYDQSAVYCVTWGKVIPITWLALAQYADEAFALIDPNWIEGDGQAPSGLDLPKLHDALRNIGADALQLPPASHAI